MSLHGSTAIRRPAADNIKCKTVTLLENGLAN